MLLKEIDPLLFFFSNLLAGFLFPFISFDMLLIISLAFFLLFSFLKFRRERLQGAGRRHAFLRRLHDMPERTDGFGHLRLHHGRCSHGLFGQIQRAGLFQFGLVARSIVKSARTQTGSMRQRHSDPARHGLEFHS